MTTGEELKNKLGLSDYKNIYFVRLINSPHKILVIIYDSRRPDFPLSTHNVFKTANFFSTKVFPFEKNSPVTPMLPIEDYNGELNNALVLGLDISGRYGNKDKQINEEKTKPNLQLFTEWLTLQDLVASEAISDFTKRTRQQRNSAVRSENYTAKIKECLLNDDGSVDFIFNTTATKPIYPRDYKFMKADPNDNFKLKRNDEKIYTITIKILDFMKWLKETRPEYEEVKKITWKEIRDVLEVAYVQVYSDSPSFHWQGINYWLSQLDGSLYPTDIEPKVWNSPHLHGNEGAFLDKHIAGIIKYFKFWYNPMASMIQKRMKEKDLL